MRLLAALTTLVLMGTGAGQTRENPTQARTKSSHELWLQYTALQRNFNKLKLPGSCKSVERAIVYYRNTIWSSQDKLGEQRNKYKRVEKLKNACAYKQWYARQLQVRSHQYSVLLKRVTWNPKVAICYVFKSYCSQALAVSWCESKWHTTAQNGQYLGMFQMGASERRLYGHGATPLEQARAANRYFIASGRDWSPWSCRPY